MMSPTSYLDLKKSFLLTQIRRGTIKATSIPGEGTEFMIFLPYKSSSKNNLA